MHTKTSANDGRGGPIVGELNLTAEDGTTLTGNTDATLAELRRTNYQTKEGASMSARIVAPKGRTADTQVASTCPIHDGHLSAVAEEESCSN